MSETGMDTARPVVSVVIPTHNRLALLSRVLDALAAQGKTRDAMEVVVVADGCTDGTLAMLAARTDLHLRVLELPGDGPAAARNAGAAAARGSLLIFLDDDVIPGKGFVGAHIAAHRRCPDAMVIGPYPPAPHTTPDLFRLRQRHWWTAHFEEMARPGHRMRYTDVLTGNLSVPAALWARLGGLDPAYHAHEDYELGLRAIRAGVPLVFAADARALHFEHETMTVERSFRRAFEEGRADVMLAKRSPEVRRDLPAIRWRRGRRIAPVDRLIFSGGGHMDQMAGWAARLLAWLEGRGLRGLHGQLLRRLQAYWYIRGLSRSLPTFADWQALADAPVPAVLPARLLQVDVRGGFDTAEAAIDAARPATVEIRYGHRLLGTMGPDDLAEPWRGAHLKPFIENGLGIRYLQALVVGGLLCTDDCADRIAIVEAIQRTKPYFGQQRSPWTWYEQLEQWRRVQKDSKAWH